MTTTVKFALVFATLISVSACTKEEKNDSSSGNIDNTLHLAFKTPDWERKIDCSHLDLEPIELNDSTFYVWATSASTNETFYFSYPQDSSEMVRPEYLKKHPIVVTGSNSAPFEFSQTLPVTQGASSKLISEAGLSADSYNEVVEIKYVGSNEDYARFQVKCRYSMMMHESEDETSKKLVTGTYHFKVKTLRQ